MGLDPYLPAAKYIKDWDHNYPDGKTPSDSPANQVAKACNVPEGFNVNSIIIDLMYWRKANAIHKWFVDNVQNGKDDCQSYYVDNQDLMDLRDCCLKVLEDHSLAEKLLPAQSGFFFGSTEYDEWYFNDLKDTVEGINRILASDELEKYDIYYRASW